MLSQGLAQSFRASAPQQPKGREVRVYYGVLQYNSVQCICATVALDIPSATCTTTASNSRHFCASVAVSQFCSTYWCRSFCMFDVLIECCHLECV
jgi:hypothetical protein